MFSKNRDHTMTRELSMVHLDHVGPPSLNKYILYGPQCVCGGSSQRGYMVCVLIGACGDQYGPKQPLKALRDHVVIYMSLTETAC